MRNWMVLRAWLGVSAAFLGAIAGGCGGTDAMITGDDGGPDVGADVRESSSSSSGGGASSSGSGGGSGSGGVKDSGADSKGSADASGDSADGADSTMGGDSRPDSPGVGDSTTPDADAGTGDSSPRTDASDASAGCAPENGPCSNGAVAGLCRSGACLPCVDQVDDGACTTAYGSASAPYLCLAGTCSPGDCRANADCASNPNGGLCGVSTPNFCGKCDSDQQCAGNSGGTVCNTGTGQCVAGTCPAEAGISLGGVPAACPVNAADICCTVTCQPGAGANACCDGPNAAAYCAMKVGNGQAACVNNVCTACPQVTGNNPNYLVDPVNGSDQTGTGDDTTVGCAFKTITRALQVVGPSPVLATTITVVGPSSASAGETFPIPLPTNVILTTTGGAVEVDVPSGKAGFTFSEVGSGINGGTTMLDGGTAPGLSIVGHVSGGDAGATGATYGVVINTGTGVTPGTGPLLLNVSISGFVNDGILVENAGILDVGTGVTSTSNGTDAARKDGLHVTGTALATIVVASGDLPTHFDGNTSHGILVEGNGSIALAGIVAGGVSGTGSVTTNGNYAAGVWIQQTPGTPPLNSIDGLVSFANTNGVGMRIVAGSNVQLRNSVLLGNQGNGVIVSAGAAAAASNDISKIDLGMVNDAGNSFGRNTLQEPLGNGNNGGAGLCLDVKVNSGTLQAAGNIFGTIDCAVGGGTLKLNSGACGNAACSGGVCDLGIAVTTGNAIDVTTCAP